MNGTLSKAWWLLALCGVLDAMHASINLLMMNLPLIFRALGSPADAAWDMGLLALLAGVCAIAAGFRTAGKDYSWLLALHGFALAAFGVIIVSPLAKGPLGFRPLSLLFTVMAASIGAFAFETARAQPRSMGGRGFLITAGTASMVFALSFIVVGFLITLSPPLFFSWMSSYFVLCAVLMLWLAFHTYRRSVKPSAPAGPFSPAPVPAHTH